MRGAVVFLVVFFAMLAASLAYPNMPPGKQICESLNLPQIDYVVLGVPATTLIVGVFNAVVYAVAAWIVFTVTDRARRGKL